MVVNHKYYMKDAYVDAFRSVVLETQAETGFELPEPVQAYVVMLLAHNMDRPDFLPEHSFAEAYLKLRRPSGYSAKELGDACLFVSGVFPSYGKKHGLNRAYYQDIGISSYDMVAETLNGELFRTLSVRFVFVSDFIGIVTRSSTNEHYNLFR
jgi:hypothetical protein